MTPDSGSPMPPPMPKTALMSAEPAGDALAREGVADDPERQREHAAGHALQHAAGDQHLDRVAPAR